MACKIASRPQPMLLPRSIRDEFVQKRWYRKNLEKKTPMGMGCRPVSRRIKRGMGLPSPSLIIKNYSTSHRAAALSFANYQRPGEVCCPYEATKEFTYETHYFAHSCHHETTEF